MSDKSNIEWTGATWTPVKGCTRVSAGCDHCYAVGMTHRLEAMQRGIRRKKEQESELADPAARNPSTYAGLTVLNGRGDRHFNGTIVLDAEALAVPLSWKKPRTIFVSSMSDIFHKDVPFEYLDRIFAVMALCPQHTFQVLTKRAARMAEYFADAGCCERIFQAQIDMSTWYDLETTRPGHKYPLEFKKPMQCEWPLPNVWLGTSVEDQAAADERIPELLKCPAAVRFLSMEPLLGAVELGNIADDGVDVISALYGHKVVKGQQRDGNAIDWVIVGGESGPKARPCDVAWIRSVVEQCKAAGVPCFVKQLGARVHCRNDEVSEWLDEVGMGLDFIETDRVGMQGDPVRVMLNDKKGADMAEWPEDLRVREMPGAGSPEPRKAEEKNPPPREDAVLPPQARGEIEEKTPTRRLVGGTKSGADKGGG